MTTGDPVGDDGPPVDDAVVFNGVDGATGGYLFPPSAIPSLVAGIRGDRMAGDDLGELRSRSSAQEVDFGTAFGSDPEDLAQAGWALIAADDTPGEVLEALTPLRTLRRQQAGDLYREFCRGEGLHPAERKQDFLARNGVGPGPAVPTKLPYYLLLVGDPERIPFRFQYQLDVQYAVGRVSFDTAEEYHSYAETVVRSETAAAARPPVIHLFGPQNPADRASKLSRRLLVEPLAGDLTELAGTAGATGWMVRSDVGEQARKERLLELLTGADAPDVLFTAGHGVGFAAADPRQREVQGALVCQDWAGPLLSNGQMGEDAYFAASDVDSSTPVRPAVVFSFACFGGGTPADSDFAHLGAAATAMAPRPFVARLPQRLLGHPRGGALAFLGHVERAWGCSFTWPGAGAQREVFQSTLLATLSGWRVGHAMEFFNERYAELSSELTEAWKAGPSDGTADPDASLASAWTANNDARSYVVVGDPAVRLPAPG